MKTLIFVLIWVCAALAVFGVAISTSRKDDDEGPRGRIPGGVRFVIALAALLIVVGIPVIALTSTSDRMPSGAGTYTLAASPSQRDGRLIFRQTCASCHTLTAANARGVYGPNLDTQLTGGDFKSSYARVNGAIKLGGATGKLMPAELLTGRDANLVSAYVAAVAGK